MIITLASSKGGVGKSTMAGCLAGAWAADGQSVHIVDLDSNRTVSRWFSNPPAQLKHISVSAPDPLSLTDHLAELANTTGPDVVVIDVAGTYERALTVAVARAHVTLIPASPAEADIFEASRVARHVESVFEAFGRKPLYRLLLNRVPSLASSSQLFAVCEIVRLQLPRINTRVMQRAAYEEIGLSGLPPHFGDRKRPTVAKAAAELDEVRKEIEQLVNRHYRLSEALEGAA